MPRWGYRSSRIALEVSPQEPPEITRGYAKDNVPQTPAQLTDRFDDQRLQVVNDSAERLADYLDGRQADVVVSALPFTTLPVAVREKVFERSPRHRLPMA